MNTVRGPATPPRHLRRLRQIGTILVKHGFPDVVARLRLGSPIAFGRRLFRRRQREAVGEPTRVRRLRLALEDLGPTFIKFGQALSTRADILPPDMVAEFSKLQDAVPPLPRGTAELAIEAELGAPIGTLFSCFDPEPVAAASIAQVHRARLASGEDVAVKVRRPGIGSVIESDLSLLGQLAWLAERYLPDAHLYQPATLVRQFARSIRREQDLAREGRTIERFAEDFASDATIRLPRVYWQQSTSAVLTLEYISGTRLSDVMRRGEGFDKPLLARRGADAVLKQILRHGHFHADPHPGNVFVMDDEVLCFLDFGIVGRIDRDMRDTLASLVAAIVRHDVERLSDVVLGLAHPAEDVNRPEFRRDLAELLDAFWDLRLSDLSMAALIRDAFAAMGRHRLHFPADLMLLIKAFVTMEGVGRQLDGSFNMVEHARPFIDQLVKERLAPSAIAARAGELGRDAIEALQALPRDLMEVIAKARGDRLQIHFVHRNLEHLVQEMDRASNRLGFAIVIAALIVGSSLLIQIEAGPIVYGYPLIALLGFLTAGFLGFWLAVGILRSGRL
jgi:ubiquinone biosynthesis protein